MVCASWAVEYGLCSGSKIMNPRTSHQNSWSIDSDPETMACGRLGCGDGDFNGDDETDIVNVGDANMVTTMMIKRTLRM